MLPWSFKIEGQFSVSAKCQEHANTAFLLFTLVIQFMEMTARQKQLALNISPF